MITLPVLSPEGKEVAKVEIDPALFGGEVNKQLLHDVVVMYQANLRVGTHFTKTRSEVVGSKRKLYRQKGTGNARVGQRRTHKRRGGGVAFGPKPRDYSYSMPKKARQLAARMALLSKFQDGEAVIVDGLGFDAPRTKAVVGVMKNLQVGGQTCLFATEALDKTLYLSARNIPGVEVQEIRELNAYSLLRRKRLVLTKGALDSLVASASKGEASE